MKEKHFIEIANLIADILDDLQQNNELNNLQSEKLIQYNIMNVMLYTNTSSSTFSRLRALIFSLYQN